MSQAILLFGGTTEGSRLARLLPARGYQVTVSVATDYGALMLRGAEAQVQVGRLDVDGMVQLMRSGPYQAVIDATHPYAAEVTKNIRRAAAQVGVTYRRILRPEGEQEPGEITVPTPQAAASMLEQLPGHILLTTGSKDLAAFSAIEQASQRIWVRILASEASLHLALELGYSPDHIIAMHGPFSKELNLALLRQFQIQNLVTKRSGAAGGFQEKAEAAQEAGARLLVIDRPNREEGVTLEELLEEFPEL